MQNIGLITKQSYKYVFVLELLLSWLAGARTERMALEKELP